MDSYQYCRQCEERVRAIEAMRRGGVCPRCDGFYVLHTGQQAGAADVAGTKERTTEAHLPAQEVRARHRDEVLLQVVPVKGQKRDLTSIMQLLNSLAGELPLSFELLGKKDHRSLLVRCHADQEQVLRARLTSIYGSPEIRTLPPDADPWTALQQAPHRASGLLSLKRTEALPLRTFVQGMEENDPLLPIFGATYQLEAGELSLVQLVVRRPAPQDWARRYKRELLALRRRQATGVHLSASRIGLLAFTALAVTGCAIFSGSMGLWAWATAFLLGALGLGSLAVYYYRRNDLPWSETQEEMVSRKIEMPGYEVVLRCLSGGATQARADRILDTLMAAYTIFHVEAGNSLVAAGPAAPDLFRSGPLDDRMGDRPFILGDEEIAGLWHLPVDAVPDMLLSQRVDHTLPDIDQLAGPEEGWLVGVAEKSAGAAIPVHLPRASITHNHVLVMGRTGTGKTNLLLRIARSLMEQPQHTLVVVDAHHDYICDLMGIIPDARREDVRVVDFADPDWRMGLNPFDVRLFDGDPEETALAFKEVAHTLFGRYWGPRMENVFLHAALALTLANSRVSPAQQYTILDMLKLLWMSNDARQRFLRAVLPQDVLRYPGATKVAEYFQSEYDTLSPQFQERVVMPVLSKLHPFGTISHLLDVFGQNECSFNFVEALYAGRIILVSTGAAALSKEFANFVGSVVINLTKRAIMRQGRQRQDPRDRARVTLLIDEAQRYNGVDYGEMFAELRKFGGNAVLATQGVRSIGYAIASDDIDDPHALSRIMGGVDTFFVTRSSGESARLWSETEFWEELEPTALANLPDFQAFVRFKGRHGMVAPFKVNIAPPLADDAAGRGQILAARASYLNAPEEARRRAASNLGRLNLMALEQMLHSGTGAQIATPIEASGRVEAAMQAAAQTEETVTDLLAGLADGSPSRGTEAPGDGPPAALSSDVVLLPGE